MAPVPRGFARFNRKVANPVMRLVAGWLPPFAIVRHRVRVTGRDYTTPVIAFATKDGLAFAVLYGVSSDWVRNLLFAGRAQIERRGATHEYEQPRLVGGDEGSRLVPAIVRGPFRLLRVRHYGAEYRGIVQGYLLGGNVEGLSTLGFDAGRFPNAAGLLPGLLAVTRTGLPPQATTSLRIRSTTFMVNLHSAGRMKQLSEAFEPNYGGVPRPARMPPIRPARSTVDLTTCVGSSHMTDLVAGTPRAVNGRSRHGGTVLSGQDPLSLRATVRAIKAVNDRAVRRRADARIL